MLMPPGDKCLSRCPGMYVQYNAETEPLGKHIKTPNTCLYVRIALTVTIPRAIVFVVAGAAEDRSMRLWKLQFIPSESSTTTGSKMKSRWAL